MNAVASRNVKFISHSDQGGRGDGVQIMVHRGYAYIGHGYSNGITVLDVRDPKNPRPVAFLPCPPDTRAIHLQTHDDLLLAVNGPSMWTMQVDAQAYYSGSHWGSWEKEHIALALDLLARAVERDPHYGPALAMAALYRHQLHLNGWADDWDKNRLMGLDLARRALRAAPDDPDVLGRAAIALGALRCRVGRHTGKWLERGIGCQIDDAACASRDHLGAQGMRQSHQRLHIDLDAGQLLGEVVR
jgi:hypothetical protein